MYKNVLNNEKQKQIASYGHDMNCQLWYQTQQTMKDTLQRIIQAKLIKKPPLMDSRNGQKEWTGANQINLPWTDANALQNTPNCHIHCYLSNTQQDKGTG